MTSEIRSVAKVTHANVEPRFSVDDDSRPEL